MASVRKIPKGATLDAQFSGRINKPDAWTHGKLITFRLWHDVVGGHTLTYWLERRIEGERPVSLQYSGKRALKAKENFAGIKAELALFMILAE